MAVRRGGQTGCMPTAAWIVLGAIALALVLVTTYDLVQKQHAVLRAFPVIGHLRYLLERIGPELRQYIVTDNDQERPFSRDQRRWVYASSKQQNNFYGFGTDNDLERTAGHVVLRHVSFPLAQPAEGQIGAGPAFAVPCAKIIGELHGRPGAFRPASVVNVSGMSYGSLSSRAVEALNRGCALAGCLQNTGEGGLTSHHLHGGELVFQLGTGYFGARDEQGRFSLERLVDLVGRAPVRMLEIKLSQGAKPGHGGILPGSKVTPEIARFRGVQAGVDCVSPPGHSEFHDVDTLIEFVERIADATGLPVGVKSAVGDSRFWEELPRRMAQTGGGPDVLTIDGGEGGTGAAPLVFADHVSLPFKVGFSQVYRAFAEEGLHEQVTFAGAGRLGFPEEAIFAMALGCDLVNVAREAMLAIGCIQAQRCHTNDCPTGVATQSKWLMRGLDPTSKSARLANYVVTLRRELLEVSRACGAPHPALVDPDSISLLDEHYGIRPARDVFGYRNGWGRPEARDVERLLGLLQPPRMAADKAGNVSGGADGGEPA